MSRCRQCPIDRFRPRGGYWPHDVAEAMLASALDEEAEAAARGMTVTAAVEMIEAELRAAGLLDDDEEG